MPQEKITTQSSLQDHEFQDWMVNVKLMRRRTLSQGELDMVPKKAQRSTYTAERFLNVLCSDTGYIVPREDIAMKLYGRTNPVDLQNVSTWGNQLQRNMLSPDAVFHAPRVGWAVGVKDFKLTRETIPLVYGLWEKMWENVSIEDLQKLAHDTVDKSAEQSIIAHMYKLRYDKLRGSNALIIPSRDPRSNQLRYRLSEREDEAKPELARNLPPYLAFDFQDWLASPDVKLLDRNPDFQKNKTLKLQRGERLGEIETRALSVLKENQGFIVPTTFMSWMLYGKRTETMKVRDNIRRIKDKLKDRNEIFSAPEIGFAVNVSDLAIPRLPLTLLNILWRKMNVDTTFEELSHQVYGEYNDQRYKNLSVLIHDLRSTLARTTYDVKRTSFKHPGQSTYRLQKNLPNVTEG